MKAAPTGTADGRACAVSFGTGRSPVGPEARAVFVRSLLIWLGLDLLWVRLPGHQLGRAVPPATVFLLIWYPHSRWAWTSNPATSNPATDLFGWTVAATALSVGVAATAATPWRARTAYRERPALSLGQGGCPRVRTAPLDQGRTARASTSNSTSGAARLATPIRVCVGGFVPQPSWTAPAIGPSLVTS